jgi:hypothetical protein
MGAGGATHCTRYHDIQYLPFEYVHVAIARRQKLVYLVV